MAFSYHDDYDRAMREVLADTPSIELNPALEQHVTLQNGESIGYKVRHKDNPRLGARVVWRQLIFPLNDNHNSRSLLEPVFSSFFYRFCLSPSSSRRW
jgi:hypothetical protein